ncbi:unnamed protein product [Ilex paraguariensis]|uniref:Uncharacterized protein n=1 Tax=Ilex paraguariensis TaxID=185542 RepID=A0ABC8TIK1_9AQUA
MAYKSMKEGIEAISSFNRRAPMVEFQEYGRVASMRLNFLASQGRRVEQFTLGMLKMQIPKKFGIKDLDTRLSVGVEVGMSGYGIFVISVEEDMCAILSVAKFIAVVFLGLSSRVDEDTVGRSLQDTQKLILFLGKGFLSFEKTGVHLADCLTQEIENEYGPKSKAYGVAGYVYMTWAGKMATELDTEVPWLMCKEDDAPNPVEFVNTELYACASVAVL